MGRSPRSRVGIPVNSDLCRGPAGSPGEEGRPPFSRDEGWLTAHADHAEADRGPGLPGRSEGRSPLGPAREASWGSWASGRHGCTPGMGGGSRLTGPRAECCVFDLGLKQPHPGPKTLGRLPGTRAGEAGDSPLCGHGPASFRGSTQAALAWEGAGPGWWRMAAGRPTHCPPGPLACGQSCWEAVEQGEPQLAQHGEGWRGARH